MDPYAKAKERDMKTFENWKAQVNRAVLARTGMECNDIGDAPYYDWFMQGVAPTVAASRAIRLARNS